MSTGDSDIKWLMEQNHNAYLTWVGSWLVFLLGIVNILMTVASNPKILTIPSYPRILVLCLYGGLVFGMVLSVYRLSNVTKDHINWAKQIRRKSFKREIFDKRGGFSRCMHASLLMMKGTSASEISFL